MAAEDTPNFLVDLLVEPHQPDQTLEQVWGRLPDETLASEEARLQQQFSTIAAKLILINQVRGAK